MKLYLRDDSIYWWADVTPPDGHRRRFSTKRTHLLPAGTSDEPPRLTKAQAQAKAEALAAVSAMVREELDRIQHGRSAEITLRDAIARYLTEANHGRCPEYKETQSRKVVAGEGFEGRAGLDPEKPFHRAVTSDEVTRLRMALRQEGNSNATVNRAIQFLSALYNHAKVNWKVRVDPDVNFPRFRERGNPRFLRPDEVERLFIELDPKRSRPGLAPYGKRDATRQRQLEDQHDLAVLLYYTGARYGEIAALTWDQVDTREWKMLTIFRWKVDDFGEVGIPARLRAVLQRRWEQRRNSAYVFPGWPQSKSADVPRGRNARGIRRAIDRCGFNAEHLVQRFGRCTIHTLRHSCATTLINNGVDIATVQKQLGHTTPTMTLVYAKLCDRAVAQTVSAVFDQVDGVTA